jgi:hypothetical protein
VHTAGGKKNSVRVFGLNKLFWKVFYGWIYNPYDWLSQHRSQTKKSTSPPRIFGVCCCCCCVFVSLLYTAHSINCAQLINRVNKCAHCWGKNLSTGIRFKQVILKSFLRLSIQPVQLIFPTSITDKKSSMHQPSPLYYSCGCCCCCCCCVFVSLLFTTHLTVDT